MAEKETEVQRLAKKYQAQRENQGTGGYVIPHLGMQVFNPTSRKFPIVDLESRNKRQDVEASARGERTPEEYINNRFVERADLNPETYLKSVYRNVPGGVEAAVASANKAREGSGVGPYNMGDIRRNVETWWKTNLSDSTPGLYDVDKDRIMLSDAMDRQERAKVARHELDHAIGRGDARYKGEYYSPRDRRVDTATVGEFAARDERLPINSKGEREFSPYAVPSNAVSTIVPAPQFIDKYYASAGEANAEFLVPIKHWAAEKGWLIRTPEDGKRAFEQYMKETGMDKAPVGPGDSLDSRRPAIMRRLYRKEAWRELPRLVQSESSGQGPRRA